MSKEDTFSGFVLETLCLKTWHLKSNLASKCTEVLQIVFLSSREVDRGRALAITRKCILDAQDMKKSERPICYRETSTN